MAAKDFPLVALVDKKSDCLSVLATVPLRDYLELVGPAYRDQGGLAGQRAPIKTKTGLKIRARLIDDLCRGAVIPPVVIGAVCTESLIRKARKAGTSSALLELIKDSKVDLSIIDGMQRTTALLEAEQKARITQPIRLELWLARKVDDLIYRMLVLNTGQVPWDLKRQLETLYKPIVETIRRELKGDVRVIDLDQANRRSEGGEYRSTRVVELFLAYTSRSVDIDVKERVAEEFARIDITEATANQGFLPTFVQTLKLMASLDRRFDRVGRAAGQEHFGDDRSGKVRLGRDVFTSLPASVGFVVAVAESLFGSPGFDYEINLAVEKMEGIQAAVSRICEHMDSLDDAALLDFVDFGTLNQRLNTKASRIGEYERNVYKSAFLVLFSKAEEVIKHGSLEPCWKAR